MSLNVAVDGHDSLVCLFTIFSDDNGVGADLFAFVSSRIRVEIDDRFVVLLDKIVDELTPVRPIAVRDGHNSSRTGRMAQNLQKDVDRQLISAVTEQELMLNPNNRQYQTDKIHFEEKLERDVSCRASQTRFYWIFTVGCLVFVDISKVDD